MIAIHERTFGYTRQRLQEADLLVGHGCYTAAAILIRTALENASIEAFGRGYDQKTFLEMATLLVGGGPRTVKRLRRYRDICNGAVHCMCNPRRRDVVGMLRMFRVLGARWMRLAEADEPAGWSSEADAPEVFLAD